MLACNVFRTQVIGVYCAVPEDRPVPAFVGSRVWQFSGKLDESSGTKLPKSFKIALQFIGFYIFHPFDTPKLAS